MSKLFIIADMDKNVITINASNIESIGEPEKHEESGLITNVLTMASGERYQIPVQLLINMINTLGWDVYDLITPKEDMTATEDVNDTEYQDETPLEDPGVISLEPYPEVEPDGYEEFTTELTVGEELDYDPTTVSNSQVEGSVANG